VSLTRDLEIELEIETAGELEVLRSLGAAKVQRYQLGRRALRRVLRGRTVSPCPSPRRRLPW
jgi:predicted signal transduction protein with EAL and GGDEF domain